MGTLGGDFYLFESVWWFLKLVGAVGGYFFEWVELAGEGGAVLDSEGGALESVEVFESVEFFESAGGYEWKVTLCQSGW